jgi:hypothetical protein
MRFLTRIGTNCLLENLIDASGSTRPLDRRCPKTVPLQPLRDGHLTGTEVPKNVNNKWTADADDQLRCLIQSNTPIRFVAAEMNDPCRPSEANAFLALPLRKSSLEAAKRRTPANGARPKKFALPLVLIETTLSSLRARCLLSPPVPPWCDYRLESKGPELSRGLS